ncbi:hypothetical protein ABZ468_08045 [Streptomyces sp. NPDC005708]|uniref:hypothetical protein n=1 Tax=Streptomyces sp. NPDC005708 TaxID=3154564 RepID=UPI0033D883B5
MVSKKQEAEVREALDAGKSAFIAEREAAEAGLLAEADIREAFGDQDGADDLRSYVAEGQQITDKYRNA